MLSSSSSPRRGRGRVGGRERAQPALDLGHVQLVVEADREVGTHAGGAPGAIGLGQRRRSSLHGTLAPPGGATAELVAAPVQQALQVFEDVVGLLLPALDELGGDAARLLGRQLPALDRALERLLDALAREHHHARGVDEVLAQSIAELRHGLGFHTRRPGRAAALGRGLAGCRLVGRRRSRLSGRGRTGRLLLTPAGLLRGPALCHGLSSWSAGLGRFLRGDYLTWADRRQQPPERDRRGAGAGHRPGRARVAPGPGGAGVPPPRGRERAGGRSRRALWARPARNGRAARQRARDCVAGAG